MSAPPSLPATPAAASDRPPGAPAAAPQALNDDWFSFDGLLRRFDTAVRISTDISDLVLESAALMVMDPKDLSAGEALGIDAMLQDEFAFLDLGADKYVAAQSLIGTKMTSYDGHSKDPDERLKQYQLEQAWSEDEDAMSDAGAPAQTSPPAAALQRAALRIQRVVRGRMVRIGMGEACALYCYVSLGRVLGDGISASRAIRAMAPTNACLRLIRGGRRTNDFVLCRCSSALAIPFTLSEMLVFSPHRQIAPEPPALKGLVDQLTESGKPADASTSPSSVKRIKGAAARKAAAKAVHTKLHAAREAAIEARCRVVQVRGELYYAGSPALEAADAADAISRGVATDRDLTLVSEAQLLVRFLNPSVTVAEVRELFSAHGELTFVRVHCSTYPDTPKTERGIEYNAATVGFKHGIDAAGARVALGGEDLLRSGRLNVAFVAGREHDINDDDEDYKGDFDGHGDESDDGTLSDFGGESDNMDFDGDDIY